MADVLSTLKDWSTTSSSNLPANSTTIGAGLDDNLQEIQGVVRRWLAHKGSNIASASTTDLGAVEGLSHTITGTTAITSFGTVSAGIWKVVHFAGTLTLTHNATSLILPGAANITTAAGDVGIFQSEGSGNWRCWTYSRATGTAISTTSATGPFSDANSLVENATDGTKEWRPRANNLTTATTRSTWLTDEDDQSGVDWFPKNLSIDVTVDSSRWLITLKDKNGGTISATNPVYIKARHSTATNGSYQILDLSGGGQQFIIGSGSTLGTIDNQKFRIWVGMFNNNGSPRIFVYNALEYHEGSSDPRTFKPRWVNIFDGGFYSGVQADNGTAADSAFVLYTTATVTTMPIRLLGYIEGQQTTAGLWTAGPSAIHMVTPGTPAMGTVVQNWTDIQRARVAASGTIPFDTSIPDNTEGTQVMSRTFAPTNAANVLRFTWNYFADNNNAENICAAMFVGSETSARAISVSKMSAADELVNGFGQALILAGTTASTTYSLRVGGASGTTQFLGDHNSGTPTERYGTTSDYVQKALFQIEEIFV